MRNEEKKSSSDAIDSLLRYFPFSTAILLAIVAILKPEILSRVLDVLSYHSNMSTTIIAILIPVLVIALAVAVYLIWKLRAMWQQRQELDRLATLRLQREREILIELFEATNGSRWKDKTRWKSTTEPVQRWKGIKVEPGTGFVNKIILPENELTGVLPDSLGELQGLIELDLRENELSGSIPRTFAQLHQLQGLYLHTNRFTGKIPDELSDLPLTGIYLFNNNFEGR
jgi:Leucine-rich repeat (LRR) protein